MGLDYSICLKIRPKGQEQFICEHEIAYWRKNFSVRDLCQEIASKYAICSEEDYMTVCRPQVLAELISAFGQSVSKDDELWDDSIWGRGLSRAQTMRELSKLCVVQSFLEDPDYETAEDMCHFLDENVSAEDFEFYFENPDAFEAVIVFFNSY